MGDAGRRDRPLVVCERSVASRVRTGGEEAEPGRLTPTTMEALRPPSRLEKMNQLGVPKRFTKSARATPGGSKGSPPVGKHACDSRAGLEAGSGGGQHPAADRGTAAGWTGVTQSEGEGRARAPEGTAGDSVPGVCPGPPEPLLASVSSQANRGQP